MQVQVNTDHNIEGSERLTTYVTSVVEDALGRFRDRVSRVEVHLSDENGAKTGGNDKRCLMEARIEGHQPIAVSHHAETVDQTVNGAAERLERSLEKTFGRLRDR